MKLVESIVLDRNNPTELLKAANELRSEAISLKELDKPIALHNKTEMGGGSENIKILDPSENAIIKIICRNESLAGDLHPVTGVPFERKIIEHNGQLFEVVVPQFDYDFKTVLPENIREGTDREQFKYCNEMLKEACESNPELLEKFTPEQIEQIKNGDRPDGYVWHHAENSGEMQLIKKEDHDQTGHTGGKAIWGGGSDNR